MKRPPRLKTATSSVAVICSTVSCVRLRTSRHVQKTKATQKITTKAAKKKMTMKRRPVRLPSVPPEDGGAETTGASVAVTVGVLVGAEGATTLCRACAIPCWSRRRLLTSDPPLSPQYEHRTPGIAPRRDACRGGHPCCDAVKTQRTLSPVAPRLPDCHDPVRRPAAQVPTRTGPLSTE